MTLYAPPQQSVFVDRPVRAHVGVVLRLAEDGDDLLVRHVRLLRDCVALAQQRWSFEVEAAVVLPREMQLLCAFWDDRFEVGGVVNLISAAFARHVPVRRRKIWSERNEVAEISEEMTALYRTMIETAPVRAGLVKTAADWPYSSAHIGMPQASTFGVAVA